MESLFLIGGLGLGVGFVSGLLGIGGGILMAPLLLYVPGLVGLPPLPMRDVAGLTIVQGLVACLSGALTHRKFHFVSTSLTLWMGSAIFLAAAAGGAVAGQVPNTVLLGVFACMALLASVLIFVPTREDSEQPDIATFTFSRPRAVSAAGIVGLFGGMVGQGGSFLLIPLMTSYLQVPTRIAIGSNLAIVFLSSLAAFLAKAVTGQIPWPLALPIVVTVVPAASLGSLFSSKVPVKQLRLLLAVFIALAAVRIGASVFWG